MRDAHRAREQFELRLDNRQIVSFVIGALVVLGVVFALGVLVGKRLALQGLGPPRPADPLAAIDQREQQRLLPESADAGPPALTFAQELTRPRPVAPAIEPTRSPSAESRRPDPAAAGTPRPADPPRPQPQAEGVAAAPAPAPPSRSAGLAEAFAKASAAARRGDYCVQIASLNTEAEAKKEAARAQAAGFPARVVPADLPGKGLVFRVRLAGSASRAEAEETADAFRAKTSRPAIVMPCR